MTGLMKRKSCVVVLVLIFLLVTASSTHADDVPLFTILTEAWAPYNFQEKGVIKGISVDMLVLMLERIGSSQGRDDFNLYPWALSYYTSLKKPGSILFTTTRTVERENLFKWVGPIFEIEFHMYALKSRNIKISSVEEIRNYNVGAHRADAAVELLMNKTGMKADEFEQIPSNLVNMRALLAGRIDLIPQTKDTTISAVKEGGFDINDFESVFLLDKKGMYYAFHKDTPDSVINMFQKAFDDLKREGKLDELFKIYGK